MDEPRATHALSTVTAIPARPKRLYWRSSWSRYPEWLTTIPFSTAATVSSSDPPSGDFVLPRWPGSVVDMLDVALKDAKRSIVALALREDPMDWRCSGLQIPSTRMVVDGFDCVGQDALRKERDKLKNASIFKQQALKRVNHSQSIRTRCVM